MTVFCSESLFHPFYLKKEVLWKREEGLEAGGQVAESVEIPGNGWSAAVKLCRRAVEEPQQHRPPLEGSANQRRTATPPLRDKTPRRPRQPAAFLYYLKITCPHWGADEEGGMEAPGWAEQRGHGWYGWEKWAQSYDELRLQSVDEEGGGALKQKNKK